MMIPTPPAILAVALMLAQAAPPPLVTEASAKAHAGILLREGTALFDRGDAAGALRKFEQAYQIFPSPKIWFDVGAAERALDRPVEALQAFQRFLDEVPQGPAESRREAQEAVATLMSSLARVKIECPLPGVEVSMDGKPVGVTPLASSLWAAPGTHQLAARREGMAPDVQDVTVVAGSERTVTLGPRPAEAPATVTAPVALAPPVAGDGPATTPPVALAPSVAPAPSLVVAPPPAAGERRLTQRWWFWTAVGAVVVAGVTGIVLATRGGSTEVPGTTLGSQGFP
jgi:hypothetical protein